MAAPPSEDMTEREFQVESGKENLRSLGGSMASLTNSVESDVKPQPPPPSRSLSLRNTQRAAPTTNATNITPTPISTIRPTPPIVGPRPLPPMSARPTPSTPSILKPSSTHSTLQSPRRRVGKRESRDDFTVGYGKPTGEGWKTWTPADAVKSRRDGDRGRSVPPGKKREGGKEEEGGVLTKLDKLMEEAGVWDFGGDEEEVVEVVRRPSTRRPSVPNIASRSTDDVRRPVVGGYRGDDRRPSAPNIAKNGDESVRRPSTPTASSRATEDARRRPSTPTAASSRATEDAKRRPSTPTATSRSTDDMTRRPFTPTATGARGTEDMARRPSAPNIVPRNEDERRDIMRRPSAPVIKTVDEKRPPTPIATSRIDDRRPSVPNAVSRPTDETTRRPSGPSVTESEERMMRRPSAPMTKADRPSASTENLTRRPSVPMVAIKDASKPIVVDREARSERREARRTTGTREVVV
ncbi:hypothetical protein BC829DRAFT_154853 [Chytridium lagenaria]|nr:hypothetical protein BC829DRAFT_154853 [Chytridium lagenaria]